MGCIFYKNRGGNGVGPLVLWSRSQPVILKGNTISFSQDIVKILDSLPSDPSILVDTIKVVFISNGVPSKEMLKKVFTVCREVVYNALTFLVQNHPLYTNI